jgi:tetratricopeptide (TPR) repeat protein
MVKEGIAWVKRAVELSPDDPILLSELGYCYAISGKADEAREILSQLEKWSRDAYVDPAALALVHLGLGEREKALEYLDKAYEQRSLMLRDVGVDARYDTLRSDERFQDLLHRMGLLRG